MNGKLLTDDSFNTKMDKLISAVQSSGSGSGSSSGSSSGTSAPNVKYYTFPRGDDTSDLFFEGIFYKTEASDETDYIMYSPKDVSWNESILYVNSTSPNSYNYLTLPLYEHKIMYDPYELGSGDSYSGFSNYYEALVPAFIQIYSSSKNMTARFMFDEYYGSYGDVYDMYNIEITGFTYIKMQFSSDGSSDMYVVILTDGTITEA